MHKSSKRPFQSMTPEAWQNLMLAAVCVFYLAQFGLDLYWHNMCGRLAVDYCSYWSAGQVAKVSGYPEAYNVAALGQVQKAIFPQGPYSIGVSPTPYLPIFLMPFAWMSFMGPYVGYWVWTLINVLVLFYYLRMFTAKLTGGPIGKRLLILILLSWPVFLNFLYGQSNLWLMICVGEYLRAMHSSKPMRAGLWLGGVLIKPQYLILIAIALLLQRSWRILLGLTLSSIPVLAISYLLVGPKGAVQFIQLMFGFANGIRASAPEVMMNWRMIGLYLGTLINPAWAWGIALTGLAVTAIGGIYVWVRSSADASTYRRGLALLGILAASQAVAWHSHAASAMMLICPLILLAQPEYRLAKHALFLWILFPPIAYFLTVVFAVLAHGVTIDLAPTLNLLSAVVPFAFNIYFLVWSLQAERALPWPHRLVASAAISSGPQRSE